MKKYYTIPISKQTTEFLFHCKNIARANSYEDLFKKVGASLWDICIEMEKEHKPYLYEKELSKQTNK